MSELIFGEGIPFTIRSELEAGMVEERIQSLCRTQLTKDGAALLVFQQRGRHRNWTAGLLGEVLKRLGEALNRGIGRDLGLALAERRSGGEQAKTEDGQ